VSTWPRQRGPLLTPIALAAGGVLLVALLLNGAHLRGQHHLSTTNTGTLTATTPTPEPRVFAVKPEVTEPTTPSWAVPLLADAKTAVLAWQQPTPQRRAADLRTIATPKYLAEIAGADPARIPHSPPATASVFTEADGFARISVTLTDGTSVLVDLVRAEATAEISTRAGRGAGRWLTTNISSGG
jgi:hypothetical protein